MPHYFTHTANNENYLRLSINCQFRTISLAILKIPPFTLAHLLLISFYLLRWGFFFEPPHKGKVYELYLFKQVFYNSFFFLHSSWNAKTPMLTHWIFFCRTLHPSSFSIFFYSKDLIISIYHIYWFFYLSSLPLNS